MILAISIFTFALALVFQVVRRLWREGESDLTEKVAFSLIAILMLGLGAGVSFGIPALVGSFLPDEIDIAPRLVDKLVTLRDQSSTQGSFFLGSGTLNNRPTYFYYRETSGGAFVAGHEAAGEGTYIIEEDRRDAAREVYGWHFARAWWRYFAFHDNSIRTVYFRVPVGTIRAGYSL